MATVRLASAFAKFLEMELLRVSMTAAELGDFREIPVSVISDWDWMSGKQSPKMADLDWVFDTLGLSLWDALSRLGTVSKGLATGESGPTEEQKRRLEECGWELVVKNGKRLARPSET